MCLITFMQCDSIRRIIAKQQDVKRLFERLLWLAQGKRPAKYCLSYKSSDFVQDLLFEYKLSIFEIYTHNWWTLTVRFRANDLMDGWHWPIQKKTSINWFCRCLIVKLTTKILKVWEILPTPDKLIDSVKRIERALLTFSRECMIVFWLDSMYLIFYLDLELCKMQLKEDDAILPLTFSYEDLAAVSFMINVNS